MRNIMIKGQRYRKYLLTILVLISLIFVVILFQNTSSNTDLGLKTENYFVTERDIPREIQTTIPTMKTESAILPSLEECEKVDWETVLTRQISANLPDRLLMNCIPASYSPKQIYELNREIKEPPKHHADQEYVKNCVYFTDRREKFFYLLKDWMYVSKELDIPWFLTFGTLLGAYRHEDMIPWDHDMDIGVFQRDEYKLRQFQAKRNGTDNFNERFQWVTRPGQHCRGNFREESTFYNRLTCDGQHETSEVDKCAFCTPLARIFQDIQTQWIDIFLYKSTRHPITKELVIFEEEGPDENPYYQGFYTAESIFPLRLCKLIGLKLPCPNIPYYVLHHLYGPKFSTPDFQCNEEGRWRDQYNMAPYNMSEYL